MLKLEEYIEKRKTEDGLNEFDSSQKMNHIKTCINYVFEYFDQYLPLQGIEKRTVHENEKLQKYEKSLREYSAEIREWFVSIYETHEKHANRIIANYLDNSGGGFPLLYQEAEFRALSYDCYADLIKRCPYLKNQTELLYKFVREYHMRQISRNSYMFPESISIGINHWLKDSLDRYNVNIAMAAEWHVNNFYNLDIVKANGEFKVSVTKYNHKKKTNLFNINTYYSQYSHKPFIKGKKKQLEILMMYIWLHNIVGDDEQYWDEYISQFKEYDL